VVTRTLAQALSESLGQPFVVENRPGADGALAAAQVMQAPPDGHTLFIATNTPMMQLPLLQKKPPFDPLKDFTPVSLVGRYTFVLVVTPNLGVDTLSGLVAYARTHPGKVNFATYSGASHLAYAQVIKTAGVEMLRVPYKGEGPSVTDILGGTVHAVFATPTSSLPHIKEGRLKALAITLPSRWPGLPDVPTTVEAGLPPFAVESFAALYGPAKMPEAIAARLSRELNAIIARPQIRAQIDRHGFALSGSTPEELSAYMKRQLDAWAKGFAEAGMVPE
jgi:tripartite-type tricarboxylate transporter receptor subunit TctC